MIMVDLVEFQWWRVLDICNLLIKFEVELKVLEGYQGDCQGVGQVVVEVGKVKEEI